MHFDQDLRPCEALGPIYEYLYIPKFILKTFKRLLHKAGENSYPIFPLIGYKSLYEKNCTVYEVLIIVNVDRFLITVYIQAYFLTNLRLLG